jgi:hypothetical protein
MSTPYPQLTGEYFSGMRKGTMKTHPILQWLVMNGISQTEFAREAGVSDALISGIVNWKLLPGREAAARMIGASCSRKTRGKLTWDDCFAELPGQEAS